MGRKKGRPFKSGRGQKRKTSEDYFTNLNTKRVRIRRLKMGPKELIVNSAKAADNKVRFRLRKKLKAQPEW